MTSNLKPKCLVQEKRSGLLELEFYGYAVYYNRQKNIQTFGQTDNCFFFHRSCAKPLQASLIWDYNTKEFFKLTDEEIAVCCASHTGEKVHTDLVKSVLNKAGLGENDLLCPPIAPLSESEQKRIKTYSKLHNNCSGKHALMLAICRQNNWDTKTYLEKDHPLQKAVYNQIKELCEAQYNMPYTPDGCGAPNWATSLEDLAKGFLSLFCNDRYKTIQTAFMKNPYISGGTGRLDTQIMQMNKKLAAKVGAGGLCYVVNTETQEVLGFKITDANMRARSIAVIETLIKIGWIDKNSIEKCLLNNSLNKTVTTETGEIVGSYFLDSAYQSWISQMFGTSLQYSCQ